jgi:hypothetical protein
MTQYLQQLAKARLMSGGTIIGRIRTKKDDGSTNLGYYGRSSKPGDALVPQMGSHGITILILAFLVKTPFMD